MKKRSILLLELDFNDRRREKNKIKGAFISPPY